MTTIVYQGEQYEIVNVWQWGSVEMLQLRKVGYLHMTSVPAAWIGDDSEY